MGRLVELNTGQNYLLEAANVFRQGGGSLTSWKIALI